MTEIQKEEYRAAARERKRAVKKKKNSEKAYFLQELIFLFQTESRAKYIKLQVVSKQVYIGDADEEHQKSFKAMTNHVNTFHIHQENLSLTKKNHSKRTLQIDYASVNTKMR